MAWPQIAIIAWGAMALGVHAAKNGEPREPFSFGWASVRTGLLIFLLYMGGFFS